MKSTVQFKNIHIQKEAQSEINLHELEVELRKIIRRRERMKEEIKEGRKHKKGDLNNTTEVTTRELRHTLMYCFIIYSCFAPHGA
jgi:hypothetical protein